MSVRVDPTKLYVTPAQAVEKQAILLNRRRACQSLAAWARLHGFQPALHHLLLIDLLEKVERRGITRLLVTLPPGSAKSTWCSKLYPA
jgi:hypothetical protein